MADDLLLPPRRPPRRPPRPAGAHDLLHGPLGRAGLDARRRRLLSAASGRVLEVGAALDGRALADAPFPDATFDTVVCTLVLCRVPDLDAALAAVRRLLAPGGRLLFLEHVRAPGARGRIQALAAPVWERTAGGCHPDRDTPAAIRRAGLVITDIERFRVPLGGPLLSPAVQGVARPRVVDVGGAVDGHEGTVGGRARP